MNLTSKEIKELKDIIKFMEEALLGWNPESETVTEVRGTSIYKRVMK